MPKKREPEIVTCPDCDGEGAVPHWNLPHEDWFGGPHDDEECPTCKGRGQCLRVPDLIGAHYKPLR